jgi:hypothetical protein
MNRPMMIEGALNRMSLMKRITEVSLSCLPYSARYVPANRPKRRADADPDHGHHDRADDGVRSPPSVDPGGGVSWVKTARLMPAKAVVEQREQDQREPGHAEQRGASTGT